MSSVSPLVRKFRKGTFVTFQSTGEDMTFSFNNSVNKFRFSKFALLDIPPIQSQIDGKNNIQFANIEGAFVDGLSTASPAPEGDKIDLSQSLQNYILNLETLLISGDNYDPNTKLTASERVFWKWIKEIGGIRYREANGSEKSAILTEKRFVEEDQNSTPAAADLYDRVVQYIGELDIDGSNRTNTNAYKEVYIYVPTQNGSTPTILFNTVADANYYAGQTIRKKPTDTNLEYISGRDASDDPTSAGLSVSAQYDMDVPLGSLNYVVNGGADQIWFAPSAPNGPNAYFTDITFDDPTTDTIVRTNPANSEVIEYKRNRLDGVVIDWKQSDYKFFNDNQKVKSFNEFNTTDSAKSFKYNAVAIYYDVYDPNNLDIDGNPVDSETNLYGILFLNDMEAISGNASRLLSNNKLKPNTIIGEQGNGYGLKLNFKFDVTSDSIQQTEVEITVDPYNTFSMELFSDTMQRIAASNRNMEKVISDNVELLKSVSNLESLILNDANKEEILILIEEINVKLEDVTPNNDLLDLINANTQTINEILSGGTTVGLDFFLDLRTEDDLRMELVNKTLTFKNKRQKYAIGGEITLNTSIGQAAGKYNTLKLANHTTLYWHKKAGASDQMQDHLYLYINDTDFKWKLGQTMVIKILDDIDFSNFGIIAYTDATNNFNLSSEYNKLIGIVSEIPMLKPEIEIICINEITYEFIISVK